MLVPLLTLFSSVSFLCYGVSCLLSQHMRQEFQRFGLRSSQRTLTGILQLVGAVGLLGGLQLTGLGLVSAAGLALMMALGFAVRLRIRDGVVASSPALVYLVINGYLAVAFARQL